MTLAELKKLVALGEGQYIEFKKKADHPDKIVRELVAFANSGGGRLFLGVDDNGFISGLPFPDEEVYVMEAALSQYVKPEIKINLQRVKVTVYEEVLVYSVPSGQAKPFYWLADKESQTFKAYVRSADQSLLASKEMYQLLKMDFGKEAQLKFEVNPLEKKLLHYLSENKTITLPDLAILAKLPKRIASRKLVYWVKMGVLIIQPAEGLDIYYLSPSFSNLE